MDVSSTEAPVANKSRQANNIFHGSHPSGGHRCQTLEKENYKQEAIISGLVQEERDGGFDYRRSLPSSISSSQLRHSPTPATSDSASPTTASSTPESISAALATGAGGGIAPGPMAVSHNTRTNHINDRPQTNNAHSNTTRVNPPSSPTTRSPALYSTLPSSVVTSVDSNKMSRQPTPGYSHSAGGGSQSTAKYALLPATNSCTSSSMGLSGPTATTMRHPQQQFQQQPQHPTLHTNVAGAIGSSGPRGSVSGEDIPRCMDVGDWRMRPAAPSPNFDIISTPSRPCRATSIVGRGGFEGSDAGSTPFATNPSGMNGSGFFLTRNVGTPVDGRDIYGLDHTSHPGTLPLLAASSATGTTGGGSMRGGSGGAPAMRWETPEAMLEMGYAYCFDRGNGQYTRLIPADMLPDLKDIPKLQDSKVGMIVLRPPQASPPSGFNSNIEPVPLLSASDPVQAQIDHIVRGAPSAAPRRPKIYCDKWVHEGVCAFTQQGCKYKHEMPFDRATQHSLGLFHGLPQWWRKHQAELQRSNNKVIVESGEASPGGTSKTQQEERGLREGEERQQKNYSKSSNISPGTATLAGGADQANHESAPTQEFHTSARNQAQVYGQRMEEQQEMMPSQPRMSRIFSPSLDFTNAMKPDSRTPNRMADLQQQQVPMEMWIRSSENMAPPKADLKSTGRDTSLVARQSNSGVAAPTSTAGVGSGTIMPIKTSRFSGLYMQGRTAEGRGQSNPLSVTPSYRRQGQEGETISGSAGTQRGYGATYPDRMTPTTPATPVSLWGPIGPPAQRGDAEVQGGFGAGPQQQRQPESKSVVDRDEHPEYRRLRVPRRGMPYRREFNAFSFLSSDEGTIRLSETRHGGEREG